MKTEVTFTYKNHKSEVGIRLVPDHDRVRLE
jgi:hypothetical protein